MVEKSIRMTSHSADDHDHNVDSSTEKDDEIQVEKDQMVKNGGDFEFLSSIDTSHSTMLSADELFFEGKLLPYSQINHKSCDQSDDQDGNLNGILLGREIQEPRIWFVDDDPSPRPPKCTVLFKELLRLNKQRSSALSSSSSSSSSSAMEEKEKEKEKEKHMIIKRIKKGLERTKSANIRIRPMFNVPISTQNGKSSSLPPLFPPTSKKA